MLLLLLTQSRTSVATWLSLVLPTLLNYCTSIHWSLLVNSTGTVTLMSFFHSHNHPSIRYFCKFSSIDCWLNTIEFSILSFLWDSQINFLLLVQLQNLHFFFINWMSLTVTFMSLDFSISVQLLLTTTFNSLIHSIFTSLIYRFSTIITQCYIIHIHVQLLHHAKTTHMLRCSSTIEYQHPHMYVNNFNLQIQHSILLILTLTIKIESPLIKLIKIQAKKSCTHLRQSP